MTDQPVVEVVGIDHAYRRTVALRGVSLTVDAGEVVAVTGPSGCGKSTLLHAAAGILRPQAGVVRLLGQDLAELDEGERTKLRRRRVGIVLQFGQLVPELSVLENVALPLLLDGHERVGRAGRRAGVARSRRSRRRPRHAAGGALRRPGAARRGRPRARHRARP